MGIDHYENFPVASWLCPPALRSPITAIYRYARTADDLADEGDATPAERLDALAAYRADLDATYAGRPASTRWLPVFAALATAIERHRLPHAPLADLLSAFAQDVTVARYADRAALLDYCRRSANPVGRLLLHLYGIDEPAALARSDAICSALQLVNFWQDLSVDLPRGRLYIPLEDCVRHGVDEAALFARHDSEATRALVAAVCAWARESMDFGAPLVRQVPGRAGWELRGVVQGGLRILDKLAAIDHASLRRRPTLGALDAVLIGVRALVMR
ncbi:MAG TPA: squalene synthase HpnC [Methylibium sp.]|uniref:squalene synthase HpnC n=1 Tax=Methylibium sp. TaxID=2067992 RepID=UPI002DBEFEBB|nr:squalene synthase HpnC [Methylibium sp.]HEU4459033.1 squalene synthase HpnC [Methylibium sp.]